MRSPVNGAPISPASRGKVEKALRHLVESYGASVCSEPLRCEALLRDLCPNERREATVLIAAVRYGICDSLQAMHKGLATGEICASLAMRLYDEAAIDREWAQWATCAWAVALGLLDGRSTPSPIPCADDAATRANGKASKRRKKSRSKAHAFVESMIVDASGAGDFERLTDALVKAPSGARIYVRPGTYREHLVVERGVEIIGEGRPGEVILTPDGESPVSVSRDASLHGLTFLYPVLSEGDGGYALVLGRGHVLLEDCRILSASRGILISGQGSSPLIRRCSIEITGDVGICCDQRSRPAIEFSTITCNSSASVAVQVTGGAAPSIRDSRMRGGHIGIDFGERAGGSLERCTLEGSAYACISVHDLGNPHISACTIADGHIGIEVSTRGRGVFEDCVIRASGEGVRIADGGNPEIRRCTIQECLFGVKVTRKGKGTIDRSCISQNRYSGISIKEQGSPTIRRCAITGNGDAGIWVQKEGKGIIEENELDGNRKGGLQIEPGSRVKTRANKCR